MILSDTIRAFVEAGPLAHVVTLGPAGAPHVTLAWVGLEGDEVVIGTLSDQPFAVPHVGVGYRRQPTRRTPRCPSTPMRRWSARPSGR